MPLRLPALASVVVVPLMPLLASVLALETQATLSPVNATQVNVAVLLLTLTSI